MTQSIDREGGRNVFFEFVLRTKILRLHKETEEEKREKVFARIGICRQDGKYCWLYDPQNKRTINEIEIPESIMSLAEPASAAADCRGTHMTILSSLTGLAARDWDNFVLMAERWKWVEAKNLRIIEVRDPRR